MKAVIEQLLRWPPWISYRSRRVYWLLLPWLTPLMMYAAHGSLLTTQPARFGLACLYFLAGATFMFTVYDWVLVQITQTYPSLAQTPQRVLFSAGFLFTFTVLIEQAAFYVDVKTGLFPAAYGSGQLLNLFVYGRVGNMVTVFLYEGLYTMNQWSENLSETEQLRKANLHSQFESLKNQVNPHFLFNSLNSLSSLIADEPAKAEEFIDEMAKVYRYLLQTNQGELTTLSTELQFTYSYYHLLKTRYRTGISLDVDVPMPLRQYQVPPLTLQMLIENAVKHNVIGASKPLRIQIKTTPSSEGAGQLLVRNNLQRKTSRVASNRVGLTNIIAKYRLLTQIEPTITDYDGYFTVCLPLLPPTPAGDGVALIR